MGLYDVTIAFNRAEPSGPKIEPTKLMVNASNAVHAMIKALNTVTDDYTDRVHHVNVMEYEGDYLE